MNVNKLDSDASILAVVKRGVAKGTFGRFEVSELLREAVEARRQPNESMGKAIERLCLTRQSGPFSKQYDPPEDQLCAQLFGLEQALGKGTKTPAAHYASRDGEPDAEPDVDTQTESDEAAARFAALVAQAMAEHKINRTAAQNHVLQTDTGKRLLKRSNARSQRSNAG